MMYNHRHFILSLSDFTVGKPLITVLLLFDTETQLSSITRYTAN